MLNRKFLSIFCLVLAISNSGCLPATDQSIFLVVDGRQLGGRVYDEAIKQILEQLPQQSFKVVKVLRLGNQTGSTYRNSVESFEFPEKFDCDEELLRDAPVTVKLKRKERDQWIDEHKGQCFQKQAQYNQAFNEKIKKLRQTLLANPDNRECISLADIAQRLAREAAALKGQKIILLTTGINEPRGCSDKPLLAVSLSGGASLKIVQLPLEGVNEFYERRTAQLQTVFPQGEIIPSANVVKIFETETAKH